MWNLRTKQVKKKYFIEPDEVLVDSGNLPQFERERFEGVIEKPIRAKVIYALGIFFAVLGVLFLYKIFHLQVIEGNNYTNLSKGNSLVHNVLFAKRGVIYDRNGVELAWNDPERTYTTMSGFAHTLGYVSFPVQDELVNSNLRPKEYVGRSGIESLSDGIVRGQFGLKIVEVDVLGETLSESVLYEPRDGSNLTLSIDSGIQEAFYGFIKDLSVDRGFQGGSGVLLDIQSGEILSMVSYPEFDSNILADAEDEEKISSFREDNAKPFLNRAVQGVYTPGSIFKPFVAIGALNEGVIDPKKIIYTNGKLIVPNPYDPDANTVFKDWKNHGAVNLYDAIANSSNVYFYQIGGGFDGQEGIGIEKIDEYAKIFGFGKITNMGFRNEEPGLVPSPEWKMRTENDEWRLGDTYNTSIGQYSLQVTPIQVARAIAAIASEGRLVTPTLIKNDKGRKEVLIRNIEKEHFKNVKIGMRMAVTKGTATGLSVPEVQVAAKTGTAEIDFDKEFVNSWVMGFFPYEDPRYSFAVVMEKGPRENFIGGVFAMRQLLEWMTVNTPEYLDNTKNVEI